MTRGPDERVADYNRGFLEGQKHSVPSPETERRLENMDDVAKSIANMQVTLARMDEKITASLALAGDVAKLKTSNVRTNTAVVIFMFFFFGVMGWFTWSLDAKIKQVVMDTTFYQQVK